LKRKRAAKKKETRRNSPGYCPSLTVKLTRGEGKRKKKRGGERRLAGPLLAGLDQRERAREEREKKKCLRAVCRIDFFSALVTGGWKEGEKEGRSQGEGKKLNVNGVRF